MNRSQCTKLNGHISSSRQITCGVPQGTKLGPILFLVLVNDASIDCCRRWKYVDDLTLGEIVKQGQQSQLQNYLDDLADWCKCNDVLPKPSKCHILTISFLKRQPVLQDFVINNVQLNRVSQIKLLGVTIQNDLKWNCHIGDIVSKASRRLYSLCILKRVNASAEDIVAVFIAYVRPILEYACQVWHTSITQQQSLAIERVQKRACRIVLGSQYTTYADALECLHLSTLQHRRHTLLCKFGEKLLNSNRHRRMLPPEKVYHRNLRSDSKSCLVQPRCNTERYSRSTIPQLTRILNRMT